MWIWYLSCFCFSNKLLNIVQILFYLEAETVEYNLSDICYSDNKPYRRENGLFAYACSSQMMNSVILSIFITDFLRVLFNIFQFPYYHNVCIFNLGVPKLEDATLLDLLMRETHISFVLFIYFSNEINEYRCRYNERFCVLLQYFEILVGVTYKPATFKFRVFVLF